MVSRYQKAGRQYLFKLSFICNGMITEIQVLGLLFGIFMAYLTFLHKKRNEFTKIEYGFWAILWISFIVVMLVPNILDPVISLIQIRSKFDFIIVVSIMFLIGALFYTYTVVRSLQRRLEKVVREVALEHKK